MEWVQTASWKYGRSWFGSSVNAGLLMIEKGRSCFFGSETTLRRIYVWTLPHSRWMVASLLTRGCFLQMPNGFPSAIQIAIARSSHRLLLLEMNCCVIVQKSLLLTFPVLVVSPVLEIVFCLNVQKSLG